MNQLKTAALLALLTVLLIFAGDVLFGEGGLYIGILLAGGMNFIAYWYSDRIAVKMTRSQPVTEQQAPELYDIIKNLSSRADLPMPAVYISPSNQPNAFAAGRNPDNAVISVTKGAVSLLNREELEGVLAHEMAHIKNRDILISTVAAVLAGALAFLARLALWGSLFGGRSRSGGGQIIRLVLIIFAPLAAILIRMAISRSREYEADAAGAQISGNPQGLAKALQRMQQTVKQEPMEVNQAAAHMFILNPLSAKGFNQLFSSHPPTEERISRLNAMEKE